jgi:phenylpropionate dioxygenase-like ring-hydroxylating dioxygenase large terminal subunit
MGTLFRKYWLPVLLAEELPEPDCPPVRVRALGEDLVAFRDTAGTVGLIDEFCVHRRASLYFGLCEDGGLRCAYHGWKFDAQGRCVDMPTANAAASSYREKLRIKSYPTKEAGGAIWAYMGPPDEMPPFREFGWIKQYPAKSHVFKMQEDCNFAQAIEGGLDMAHAPILHRRRPFSDRGMPNEGIIAAGSPATTDDLAPNTLVDYREYGLRLVSEQTKDEATDVVAIIPFIPPAFTVVPPSNAQTGERMVNFWMPRDDYSTWHIQWLYSATGVSIDVERRIAVGGHWVDKNYRKLRNKDNDYLLDRHAQRTRNFSGMEGIVTEDHAMNESQGPIMDRTKERLGSIDVAVIAMRRMLLGGAKSVMAGGPAPGLIYDAFDEVKSERFEKPKGSAWIDHCPGERRSA